MIYLKMPDGREYDVWHGYAARYLIFKEPTQRSALMQGEFISAYREEKERQINLCKQIEEDYEWQS